ncbi:MAG: YjbH domain-containing protein [Deferribacteres bacterium]|nr:YjbH domain-containing protein [Deferribacteres bacterium]
MEIPTARVMKENTYRLGGGQVRPYRYYYGTISPLKGLEINGRITEVMGVPGFDETEGGSYGDYKDKAIDLKYRFFSEGKYMPALAIGLMDPHGTRLYSSQYLVASKQIYPFDFTLGFGNGRFGERPLPEHSEGLGLEIFSNTAAWFRDSRLFWGIQFAPSDKFALMYEYSPIKYHKQTRDPAQPEYFREPVSSSFNFGMRYKPSRWSEIDMSYQRGNQIGINLSVGFDIGKPVIPLYDKIYKEKPAGETDTVYSRLVRSLHKSGFSDISVFMEDNDLWIEAQNDKYFYNTRAIGVVMDILSDLMPQDARRIHIILRENGIPLTGLTFYRIDLSDLYSGRMTLDEFLRLSEFGTAVPDDITAPRLHRKQYGYGLKPDLQMFINDPSGFFRYRLGLKGWLSYHPWEGSSFVAALAAYPLNNISTANEPLSIPVRSDLVFYKKEKIALDRLMFDQTGKLSPDIFGRFSAGLLEVQYAGIDAEIAMPVLDGRILLGLSGSAVRKRRRDNPFKLADDDSGKVYTTAFFNTRLNIPESEIALDIKAGRFLAGDRGMRVTISKHINGVTVWAWYSITDTSVFRDDFNRGYHDKGIGVSIPLRLFKGTDSRSVYSYLLSPWTRDTGQDIDHFGSLFDLIGRNTRIFLDKDKKMLYR